jgi:H+/Cl- antiporter ClcA
MSQDDDSRMPEDLEAILEAADEEEAEEADEGRFDAPPLPPLLILAVVGLLCGFATIALVWLSERSCERFRDTTNCGALGLPLLVLIVVVTIVLGGLALSRLAMPHPRLIAFLGVAFMQVLVLAFLTGNLDSPRTLAVVPVLTAITFLLANLVARLLERADA